MHYLIPSRNFTSIHLPVSLFVFCLSFCIFFYVSFLVLRRPEWLLIIVAVRHSRDGLLPLQIEPADQIHAGCATGEITRRENCRSSIASLHPSARFFPLSIRLFSKQRLVDFSINKLLFVFNFNWRDSYIRLVECITF